MNVAEAIELDFESIIKETDKAYQIKFDAQTVCWLPKSQVRILDDILYMPKWLVANKNLEQFKIN